ncbi:hypothetical protein B0H13DRAFT_1893650 [Mycena leptocephala]|nr:hypothetical protein B0H13DRAFT_1908539 [Mycena leptocephala]KAJ7876404.1 hypothetical protein B0H13DRAFT_1893650 [Mycena leptocephala]
MYCTADPRLPQFYHHRYALGVATAKLKSRGEEKKGLATNTLAVVKRQVAKMQANIQSTVEKEDAGNLEIGRKRKKRHSADRDDRVVHHHFVDSIIDRQSRPNSTEQLSSMAKSGTFWCCKPSTGVLEDFQF